MSNFVAFFPSRDCPQVPRSFSELTRILRGPLQAGHVQTEVLNGAAILRERSFNRAPRFYTQEDGAGWIVVKGEVFDVRSKTPTVNLEELLHYFLAEDLQALNRYRSEEHTSELQSRQYL